MKTGLYPADLPPPFHPTPPMFSPKLPLPLLACLSLLATASAQSLTGHVLDPNGVGIVGATMVFSNGGPVVTTGVGGAFTASLGLSNRRYDIQVDPRLPDVAPTVLESITVNGATNIGAVTLPPGATITGTIADPNGVGLLGGNIALFDAATGVKLWVPHNGTDINGNYSVVAPLGDFYVRLVGPVGLNLYPYYEPQTVASTAPLSLGVVNLRQAYAVTGSVVDSTSLLPVSGTEIEVYDALTDRLMPLSAGSTNIFGAFSIDLPFGLYRFELMPQVGAAVEARQLFNVTVLSATSLGQVTMDSAVQLSGTVMGPLGAVADADIDVVTIDGYKLFTINDNTGVTGAFSVAVKPGTYMLRVDPQAASGLVGLEAGPFTVAANTNVGALSLQAGLPLQVHVQDALGAAIAGIDLDVVDVVTGQEVVIVGDVSDAAGNMTVHVPAGTYDLTVSSPQGSVHAPASLTGVSVVGPAATAATVVMQDKILVTDFSTYGTPGAYPGGFPVSLSFHVRQPTSLPVNFELFVEMPDGSEAPLLPSVALDLIPNLPLTLGGIWIPVLPIPPGQTGRVLNLVTRYTDPVTGTLLDRSELDFFVN
jgi:hypothetical protein